MKTISELSGTVIRMAAAALAEARRALPSDEPATASPPSDAAPQVAEVAGAEAPGVPVDAGPEASDVSAAPPAPPPKPEPLPESDAVKAALDEAVAKATGFSGDRLAMLRAAVEVATPRMKDVRLVRVFGVEEKLSGGHVIGEYQYVVDLFPAAMKQTAGAPKEERGRGGGRRGPGGGGGGGRGAKGSATGGFSMDSLRDDRKKEGGGHGRPGGARRPGSGAGRPPGAAPKK